MNIDTVSPPASSRKASPPPDVEDASPSKLRILIVDDAVLCRKFHERVLGPSCELILEASNGNEAVERVKECMANGTVLDGILMDSSMPFMNGPTATTIIREIGYRGKIFGVTGNAYQADIDDFIMHGVDEVLIKPINKEQYAYIAQAMRTQNRIKRSPNH